MCEFVVVFFEIDFVAKFREKNLCVIFRNDLLTS